MIGLPSHHVWYMLDISDGWTKRPPFICGLAWHYDFVMRGGFKETPAASALLMVRGLVN